MKKKKRGRGRPTDYVDKKTCAVLAEFTEEMNIQNFKQHCSIYHVALLFRKNIDTIYEWQKQHAEFSEAIKNWETKRNALAFEVSAWSDARWIFCMKNWTEMTDKQSVEHSGNIPLTVISAVPRPERAK